MSQIHHAEMAHLIRREKELERTLNELRSDFGTWKERVELARNTGRDELAMRAQERLDEIRNEGRDLRRELKLIVAKKRLVRRESRRPSGDEVRRAEALLESFRQSGLVDPEEAQMEAEFDELRHNEAAQTSDTILRDDSSQSDQSEPSIEQERDVPEEVDATPEATDDSTSLDDLDLEALENLDLDELERLVASEEN